MKFDSWYLTDVGRRRETNQDSCLINRELGLFIVADGMGGHSGGEVASAMAVETVEEMMLQPDAMKKSPRELLQLAYEEASRRIFDKAATERPELAGMGTTMVMAHVRGKHLYVGNVGDSRCYLFKKPYLYQITEDHSLINEQLRAGVMTEEQVMQFVGRNVITRSVGYERDVYPDIIEREISPGEIFLMCSDGLSGLVSDQRISEILNQNTPDKAVKACVEQALANGGDDNVTVMLLHFHE
ncbi:Stp1/IreP family PP2C-type Ser/Thr phosphatase [Bdellovibrio svalbardensis]|uniref:Stp1/IreP family PP2C-type Ser/Thr phosphatase n=1 Tax=Bdellovibrio svalbardensis TaxID=2972972 RepID=A0ABT6DKN9_9BACT|nr:Stp1/IreP family PP2C-type Ser/Thr phosphatase [Bdellovibrio svalbardensis]MDG0817119.1 Stp1/IreP family PP2C-type Ser/Thr phosphatase [Bdellovibrio svalbardensis]